MTLLDDLDLLGASAGRAENRAIDYFQPTGPQQAWADETAMAAVWRDANQIGKTLGLIYDLIRRCRGESHWKRPPIKALVISISHEQMGTVGGFHEKLWEMLPKDEIEGGFEPGRGITGKPPRIVFTSGPGKGSVISFATYAQGASRIAGPTIDLVLLDEPPPASMWEEVTPRLFRRKGLIRCGFTPTLQTEDVGYLREYVEAGKVKEHNYGMTEYSLWPVGRLRPLSTEAEIRIFEESLPILTRDMRMGRSWAPMLTGRWLLNFTDANILPDDPEAGAEIGVSIDHGANAGKQVATLIGVHGRTTPRPRVWWWDEAASDGTTTPEQDCDAIFEMLDRNDVPYDSVDWWVGDKPTGRARYGSEKSNRDLRIEIARRLKRPVEKTKPIETIKKWDGSIEYGVHLMNTLFARRDENDLPHGIVHPRCARFIEGCRKWKGDKKDPVKDALDAGRYGAQHGIDKRLFEFIRLTH